MQKKRYIDQLLLNYGLNTNLIFNWYNSFGLNSRLSYSKLKKKHSEKINLKIKNLLVGKKLRNRIRELINFSIFIKTFKGMRHRLKYPSRGQRTHTNAKTKRKFQF